MREKNNERFSSYGWDRHALFYPTSLLQGGLMVAFLGLVALHFGEIIGIAGSQRLLAGFFPLNYGYHILHTLLSLVFVFILYRNWPESDTE